MKARSAVCGVPLLLKMIIAGCEALEFFSFVPSHDHFHTWLPLSASPISSHFTPGHPPPALVKLSEGVSVHAQQYTLRVHAAGASKKAHTSPSA